MEQIDICYSFDFWQVIVGIEKQMALFHLSFICVI